MCFHSFYKKKSKQIGTRRLVAVSEAGRWDLLSFNQEHGLYSCRAGRLAKIALAQLRPLFARSGINRHYGWQNSWLTPRFMCSKIASPPWSNNRSKKTAPTMMVMAKVDVLLKSKWYTELVSDILAGECALRRTGCRSNTASSMSESARKLSLQRPRSQNRGTFDCCLVFSAWFCFFQSFTWILMFFMRCYRF